MNTKEYVYPDTTDDLVIKRVMQTEPYPEYWIRSEFEAFEKAFDLVEKSGKGLYLGAGRGRLLSYVKSKVGDLTAVEPDPQRYQAAKNVAAELQINIINKQHTCSESEVGTFDVVFSGYVIQHILKSEAEQHIAELTKSLKIGGKLLLVTNFSQETTDTYSMLARRDGIVEEPTIAPEDYEVLLRDQAEPFLPIRYFALDTLKTLLNSFSIETYHTFHDTRPRNFLDTLFFRDELFNKTFLKNKFGRHIVLVAKKIK